MQIVGKLIELTNEEPVSLWENNEHIYTANQWIQL